MGNGSAVLVPLCRCCRCDPARAGSLSTANTACSFRAVTLAACCPDIATGTPWLNRPTGNYCLLRHTIEARRKQTVSNPPQAASIRRNRRGRASRQHGTEKLPRRTLHLSSGRSERLMRVTTASQERFSRCGYLRSKQWIARRAPPEKLHRL
jgi:hypothetical protein